MAGVGRPTKYNENMVSGVGMYLESCRSDRRRLPTKEGLALYLGINTDTLVEWVKQHEEFSVAIKELEAEQKNKLVYDGLYNPEANSTMAIFLLKANHGMVETEKKILAGDKHDPLTVVMAAENKK